MNHSRDECARGNAHSNTVEGVFSIFKRGMVGIYQHCEEQHLQRYLANLTSAIPTARSSGLMMRAAQFAHSKEAAGKRLTYRTTRGHQGRA